MKKFSFYLGASASAWMLAILVIAAELSEPFKNLLKSIFTHHWIGKAAVITFAFLLFGFMLNGKKSIAGIPSNKLAWYSMLGSLVIILLFFAIEFLK